MLLISAHHTTPPCHSSTRFNNAANVADPRALQLPAKYPLMTFEARHYSA